MPLYRRNQFDVQVSTNQSNLGSGAGVANFFNGNGAGYSVSAAGVDRRISILRNGVLTQATIILQQATSSTTGTGGTVSFVNHTKGTSVTLASSLSTTADNSFYETKTTGLQFIVSSGDQCYFQVSGFSAQPTNLRIMGSLYFSSP
jgi:hypothetical protein